MSAAIEVRQLCKHYDGHLVVDHVDLDVVDGEIVGLIGANGAGKTTTAECIQGLRRADAGVIRVLGLDPWVDGAKVRSLVGSQLQESALPDRMRVGEALTLFAGPRAVPVDGLLAAFGLDPHRRRAYSALSGGQRQRLFLVLALLNRPRLVILDELTQGLDPAARRDVGDAIRSLRDAGTTVLLVTHHMDEAEALCDRVAVMGDGRVLDTGTPDELIARHGRAASVRFGCPAAAHWPDGLARLPGVDEVRRRGATVEVVGDRRMVAPVCADLVARGEVPDDLAIALPNLEAALLALLADPARPERPAPARVLAPTGGAR